MPELDYLSCTIPPSNLLGVFAKYWEPGAVKTRLAATIGQAVAAEICRAFTTTVLVRLREAANAHVIGFDPPQQRAAFTKLGGRHWGLWPQPAGDLGFRMRTFFELALGSVQPVVLVGSDSPDLPVAFLERAFAALQSHDVVLGPTRDGGYYLIGAAGKVPPVFEGISWSNDQVWQQTLRRLDEAHLSWHQLPEWYDVDDEQDLNDLLVRLDAARHVDAHLARLHDELKGLLSGGGSM